MEGERIKYKFDFKAIFTYETIKWDRPFRQSKVWGFQVDIESNILGMWKIPIIPHLSFKDEEPKAQKILYDLPRAVVTGRAKIISGSANFQSSAFFFFLNAVQCHLPIIPY